MKIFKNTAFVLFFTLTFITCSKNTETEKLIDLSLLTNKWELTSKVVDGVVFSHQNNCNSFHTTLYKSDMSVDVDYFQEVSGNCNASNTPNTWSYAVNNNVIEISIAGTIHFKYKIIELNATTLKVDDITSSNYRENTNIYTKI